MDQAFVAALIFSLSLRKRQFSVALHHNNCCNALVTGRKGSKGDWSSFKSGIYSDTSDSTPVALSQRLASGRFDGRCWGERGLDRDSRIRAHSIGILGPAPPHSGDPCLHSSVYWHPAALNCRYVVAGKKCKSRASTRSPKETTRIFAYTNVPYVTMRCGSLFGLLTLRRSGPFGWRPRMASLFAAPYGSAASERIVR
jgi:hypothetical protein